jgi:hypothetical protein
MLRKNTAGQHFCFALVNASTGAALTGATVSAYRSIDGAAQASATGTVTETTNGQYSFAPSQADTNGNQIGFLFIAASAIPLNINIVTTACDPTSTAFGLSLAKTTNITGFNDIASTTIVSAGAITTNAGKVSGVILVDGLGVSQSFSTTGSVGSVQGGVGGNLTGSVGSVVGAVTVGTNNDKTGYSVAGNVTVGGYASGQDPATLVLDVAASTHNATNTVGNKISSAASAGDPWTATLPGAYGPGTAGSILGHNLDAMVSTRSTYAGGPVALAANGVDNIVVDTGINLRQAASVILAGAAGKVSGAGTGAVQVNSAGASDMQRIAAVVDTNGNRTGVTLTLPS